MSRSSHPHSHPHPQIIDPSSVQRQFHALVEDKKHLTAILTQADTERKKEEETLHKLRKTQISLNERHRIASSHLGSQRKKLSMLQDEMNRLEHKLSMDRKDLEQLAKDRKVLEHENVSCKYQFVKEMDVMNDEMVDTLRQIDESKLEHLLNVDVVEYLEQCLIQRVKEMELLGHGLGLQDGNNGGAIRNDESGVVQQSKSSWADILTLFQGTRQKFVEGMTQLSHEKEAFRGFEKKALELRTAVQRQNMEVSSV